MSLATIYSRAQVGIHAPQVTIEVHLSNGLPGLSIVGLAETEVKESKDRVRAALINSQFEFPARRITINLAPADLPKEGSRFDLPIAMGILVASGQIPADKISQTEFIGELALEEAHLVNGLDVMAHHHLLEVCQSLGTSLEALPEMQNVIQLDVVQNKASTPAASQHPVMADDLADVIGQSHAKRALEIAAAGGHNLLMLGPPGTGKTMLATRLPGILPRMTENEALESASLQSISYQGFDVKNWRQRIFRAPHHTASGVALVGGGSQPQPGEISLAHHGVLFLDELPEFDRRVLEVLREPLESGKIVISRAARQAEFPARFQLIAAMNPCPCGYLGHPNGRCHCTPDQIKRYRSRISGPLLDRIDMHIEVPSIPLQDMQKQSREEHSEQVKQRVIHARDKQNQRTQHANALMSSQEIKQHCKLDKETRQLLSQAVTRLGLSARSHNRILKVARTIADLSNEEAIQAAHISEAISYRRLDRGLV